MYTSYVMAPPPRTSLPVHGSADRFAVRRIYCIGRNYAEHVREMGGDPSREPPIFFGKPADAIAGAGGIVPYPPGTTDLHHEVEQVAALTPAAQFGAPDAQGIWLKVNGQERQRSTLDQLIWPVQEVIAALSRLVTLQAGDLIFTGTPQGVSALAPGDEVTAGIEGLQSLEFRIGPGPA
jgi:fumarylpyruvate hydrolase